MAPATDFPRSDERELSLRWSGRVSLTPRILAVNIFALAMLAGGFFYLDSYRSRIVDTRTAQAGREVRLAAEALNAIPAQERPVVALRLARDTGARIRLYDPAGALLLDTRALGLRNFVLHDPSHDPTSQVIARFLDAMIDTVVGASRAPLYRERAGNAWPDVRTARAVHGTPVTVWRAPDRTPVITAAAPLQNGDVVLTTTNARDITQTVRVERYRLSVLLLIVSVVSVLLSLFLARTIVRPLRHLVRAAVRVRLGRAREVVVPRLPSRRDELGLLARALSDMTLALRARIDATEAFAADVAHEMKNPLASLRSAVDALSTVRDPVLQEKLLAIVQDDVLRMDRLITDIAEASRLDAQLSRANFERVDVAEMLAGMVDALGMRGAERGIKVWLDAPRPAPMIVLGEPGRLERVFANLIDNAVSFSPDYGLVTISALRDGRLITIRVEDEGPGVPEDMRETIFRRFHSHRPEGEAFGKHSGLGLAIARTIIDAHGGSITAQGRKDRLSGARFVVRLPAADER